MTSVIVAAARPALSAAWGVGSLIVLATLVARVSRFRTLLKTSSNAPPELECEVGALAGRLGVSRPPAVRVLPGLASPMVYWLGRRVVLVVPAVLPDGLSPPQRRAVLAHELAHLRRRDHWVRLLETLATVALWWHPLVWLARRGLHAAEEQCCDAWVVWAMPDARRAYADALVDTLSMLSSRLASAAGASLPPGASGLGELRHVRRRLVMIMSDRGVRRSMSPMGRAFVGAIVLALPVLPALGQRADAPPSPPSPPPPSQAKSPSNDEQVRQLRERVRELEQRLERAEQRLAETPAPGAQSTPPSAPDAAPAAAQLAAPEPQRRAEQAKARQRMRADSAKYTREQIAEAEEMYQVANKNWRSDEARQSLEAMVAKYPDLNRTGCAILYLGQYSRGEQRERYLKQSIDKYSDCFYGNGVQVGAFARYLLALDYQEAGKADEATRLFREILTTYPTAVTHRGDDLTKIVKERMKAAAPATAPATAPSER